MARVRRFRTVDGWLRWQETLHPRQVELGLDRSLAVLGNMGLADPPWRRITVAGTNGKGSCVAMLEQLLLACDRKAGAFSSPHLRRYNERIRINGAEVGDTDLIDAFEQVDRARGEISLTYFEFSTLAAIWLFTQNQVDVAVLEVGLGGRLDASNIIDPDVAVITSLALDHQDWLGDTLDQIAREKAGIMRPGRPAICGMANPPQGLIDAAGQSRAKLSLLERDFFAEAGTGDLWRFRDSAHVVPDLPRPDLVGDIQLANAACAMAALLAMGLGVDQLGPAAMRAFPSVRLEGRFQQLDRRPQWILDVAHNAAAAGVLAQNLHNIPCTGRTLFLIGMLADKDALAFAQEISAVCDRWYGLTSGGVRGRDARSLAVEISPVLGQPAGLFDTAERAIGEISRQAKPVDRIVACGSFTVVGPVLDHLTSGPPNADRI